MEHTLHTYMENVHIKFVNCFVTISHFATTLFIEINFITTQRTRIFNFLNLFTVLLHQSISLSEMRGEGVGVGLYVCDVNARCILNPHPTYSAMFNIAA